MGSKNRHAKELLPIILKDRKPDQWYVEPFVGGANMIDKVDGLRIGCDSHYYLIELLKAIQGGWIPPEYVSPEEYKLILEDRKNQQPELVGFVGFCCSFGGKWMGGFARNIASGKPNAEILNKTSRNYCAESKRNLLKQAPNLQGVIFKWDNYNNLIIPPNSLIYCDPPYAGTTKYKDSFDHVKFWQWVRDKHAEGHTIFVSEYSAPEDFTCVWSKQTLANFSLQENRDKSRVEKLFTLLS